MKSNFPHSLPWVIQGFDSGLGRWLDSKHGGNTVL
jgi:hypothetical protein